MIKATQDNNNNKLQLISHKPQQQNLRNKNNHKNLSLGSSGNTQKNQSEYKCSYSIKSPPLSSIQIKTPSSHNNCINYNNHNNVNLSNHKSVHSPPKSISSNVYIYSIYPKSLQSSPKRQNISSQKNSIYVSPYKQTHNSSLKKKQDIELMDQVYNNCLYQNTSTKSIYKTPQSAFDNYDTLPHPFKSQKRSSSNNKQYENEDYQQRFILPRIVKENKFQSLPNEQKKVLPYQQPNKREEFVVGQKKRNHVSLVQSRNKLDDFIQKQVDNNSKQQYQQDAFNTKDKLGSSYDAFQRVLKEVRDSSPKKNQQHRIINRVMTMGEDDDEISSFSQRNRTFDNYNMYLEGDIPLYKLQDHSFSEMRSMRASSETGDALHKKGFPKITTSNKFKTPKAKARSHTLTENNYDERHDKLEQEEYSKYIVQSEQNVNHEKNLSSIKSPKGKNKRKTSSSREDQYPIKSGLKFLDFEDIVPYQKGKNKVTDNNQLQGYKFNDIIEDMNNGKIRKQLRNSNIKRKTKQKVFNDQGTDYFISKRHSTQTDMDSKYFSETPSRLEKQNVKTIELNEGDTENENDLKNKAIDDFELYKQYLLYKLQRHPQPKSNNNQDHFIKEESKINQKQKVLDLPPTHYSQKLMMLEKRLQRRNTENDILESKFDENIIHYNQQQNKTQQKQSKNLQIRQSSNSPKLEGDSLEKQTSQQQQQTIMSGDSFDIELNLSYNNQLFIEQWKKGNKLRLQCQLNIKYGNPISTRRRNLSQMDFIFVVDNQEKFMNKKGWQIQTILKNFIRELDDIDSVCLIAQNSLKNEFEKLTQLCSEEKRKILFKLVDNMQKTQKSGMYNLLLQAFKVAQQKNDKSRQVNILVFGNNDGIQTYWRLLSNLLFQTSSSPSKDSPSIQYLYPSLISLNSSQQNQPSIITSKYFCFDSINLINRLCEDIFEISIELDREENVIQKLQSQKTTQLVHDQHTLINLNNTQQQNQKQLQSSKRLSEIVEQNEEDNAINSVQNFENHPEFQSKMLELKEFSKITLQKTFNIQQEECLLEVRVNPMFKDIFKIIEFYEEIYNQDSQSHVYIFQSKLADKGKIKTISFEIETEMEQFTSILQNQQYFIFQEYPIIQAILANHSPNTQTKNDLFLNLDENNFQNYQNLENSQHSTLFNENEYYRSKTRHLLQKFCCKQSNYTPSDSTNFDLNLIQSLQILGEEINTSSIDNLEKQNLQSILQSLYKEIVSQSQQEKSSSSIVQKKLQ